jgi:hypothetical protein
MNDDDLFDGLRADLADVRLGTPVQDVLARGRQLHRSRRVLPALGAGTGTAAAAVALTLGLIAPAAAPAPATLTDWSVTTGPHGTVNVAIRDHRESKATMSRLTRALRAAGVPALVRTELLPNCRLPDASKPIVVSPAVPVSTFKIHIAHLAKNARVVVLVPAIPVAVQRAIKNHRAVRIDHQIQVENPQAGGPPVRVIPAIKGARSHGRQQIRLVLPQIVVISPGGTCTPTPRQNR